MKKIFLAFYFLTLLSSASINSMGKTKEEEQKEGPNYIALRSDQGIYHGIITDDSQRTKVTKISFAGQTTIDGIRKEKDNSVNRVKIAELRLLEVITPLHESKRYPDKEYSEVKVTTLNGNTEYLLFPRLLTICAEAVQSKIEKSWYLYALNNIEVHQITPHDGQPKSAHHTEKTSEEKQSLNEAAALLSSLLTQEPQS